MDSLFAHHAIAGRCIVCVFGAPACGKTTLIARIEREMRDAGGVRVKAIKFDDLMQAELARLDEVRSASSEDEVSGVDVFSRRAWRDARSAGKRQAEELLSRHRVTSAEIAAAPTLHMSQQPLAIIIEDTMELRSMRHSFRQLARKYANSVYGLYIYKSARFPARDSSVPARFDQVRGRTCPYRGAIFGGGGIASECVSRRQGTAPRARSAKCA